MRGRRPRRGDANQPEQSKAYGNQLAQCAAAARGAGLEIHAWKVCWNLALADKNLVEKLKKQGRLQRDNRGVSLPWLCPSDPANVELELNTIVEVLENYDVDGIHLDYIRYPDGNACYCPGCRERYENFSGQPVGNWPAEVISGKREKSYKAWRRAQITKFVQTVRREMKKIKPQAKLSAAVYPKYPECAESMGQDWGSWLKEGTVDFVCPMDYMPSASSFREILARQLALPNGSGRIYPGIGATLDTGDLPGEIFLDQLRALRECQAGGFMLFDLNPSLAANFLPLIAARTR